MSKNYISEIDKVYYENTYGLQKKLRRQFHIPQKKTMFLLKRYTTKSLK